MTNDPLSPLRFLVGRWRGAGTVSGDPVTAEIEGASGEDDCIVLVHTTHREGAADHGERIVIRVHRGRTSAFIRSGSGPEQRFQSVPALVGWRFTRADPRLGFFAWEIEPDGPDAFRERFILGEDAAAETVVALRHTRA